MPKYKWIRETPWAKVGEEFENEEDAWIMKVGCTAGWIELVPEQPKRWKPEPNEYYWTLNVTLEPVQWVYTYDFPDDKYELGGVWRTEAEAQHAAEETRRLWLQLHENKNLADAIEKLEPMQSCAMPHCRCMEKTCSNHHYGDGCAKSTLPPQLVNISSPNETKEEVSKVCPHLRVNKTLPQTKCEDCGNFIFRFTL